MREEDKKAGWARLGGTLFGQCLHLDYRMWTARTEWRREEEGSLGLERAVGLSHFWSPAYKR